MNLRELLNFIITKQCTKLQIIGLSIIMLLPGIYILPSPLSQTIPQAYVESTTTLSGQILYAPMWGTSTYLIDNTGTVNHTWPSSYFPGVMVRWLGDGTILRTIRVGAGHGGGGSGGGVQKVQWDGTVIWDFRYDTDGHLSHHDVKSLPNGNVLLIAWETKTLDEAIAAGRNPNTIKGDTFIPDHIIEVKPTGPTSGEIVWEWHVWDHLIQDYNSSKANYGVVADYPELVDINYGEINIIGSDWLHTNSIDYTEEFDQILISVRNFNEIWVIDHSTTPAEAASHSGGNSGKGGDILYRWGNPEAYRAGITSDEKLFYQHDATWIESGYPGEGNILVFNNGANRPSGQYSTVDEITPPVNDNGEYYLNPGSPYGPENVTWSYIGRPPASFYAAGISGAHRLKDGGTLICDGETGRFFEVSPDGTTVWEYENLYPSPVLNDVFKIVYIPLKEQSEGADLDCSGSLSWTKIEPGTTVNGSFQLQNIGGANSTLNWTINTSSISWGTWTFTPESGTNLTPDDGLITVQVSVIVPDEKNSEFQGYVRVKNINDPTDFDVIPVTLKTPVKIIPTCVIYLHQFLSHFFQNHLLLEKLLYDLIS